MSSGVRLGLRSGKAITAQNHTRKIYMLAQHGLLNINFFRSRSSSSLLQYLHLSRSLVQLCLLERSIDLRLLSLEPIRPVVAFMFTADFLDVGNINRSRSFSSRVTPGGFISIATIVSALALQTRHSQSVCALDNTRYLRSLPSSSCRTP